MNGRINELPIPGPGLNDPGATEILRVWPADGKQHVSLATGLWEDAASWGIMLVDLAKHVANAYKQTRGKDRAQTLRRLREGFDAEWTAPTDIPTGQTEGD